jgi:hypothetical protein
MLGRRGRRARSAPTLRRHGRTHALERSGGAGGPTRSNAQADPPSRGAHPRTRGRRTRSDSGATQRARRRERHAEGATQNPRAPRTPRAARPPPPSGRGAVIGDPHRVAELGAVHAAGSDRRIAVQHAAQLAQRDRIGVGVHALADQRGPPAPCAALASCCELIYPTAKQNPLELRHIADRRIHGNHVRRVGEGSCRPTPDSADERLLEAVDWTSTPENRASGAA